MLKTTLKIGPKDENLEQDSQKIYVENLDKTKLIQKNHKIKIAKSKK